MSENKNVYYKIQMGNFSIPFTDVVDHSENLLSKINFYLIQVKINLSIMKIDLVHFNINLSKMKLGLIKFKTSLVEMKVKLLLVKLNLT